MNNQFSLVVGIITRVSAYKNITHILFLAEKKRDNAGGVAISQK